MARSHHRHVSIVISVPEAARMTLDRQARERGLQPSLWASQLFDIGFSAICSREKSMPVTDDDLDAITGAALLLWSRGDWDTASIAAGLGVSEQTVSRILDGWREYRRAS